MAQLACPLNLDEYTYESHLKPGVSDAEFRCYESGDINKLGSKSTLHTKVRCSHASVQIWHTSHLGKVDWVFTPWKVLLDLSSQTTEDRRIAKQIVYQSGNRRRRRVGTGYNR